MLIIWKTRDSLMDVDFVSAARLVSLASHSRVPYLPARYNAEHSPTYFFGQILRILGRENLEGLKNPKNIGSLAAP